MRILVLCTDQGVRVPGEKGASLHLRAVAQAHARLGHEVLLMGVAGHGEPDLPCRTWLLPHPGRAEGLERERRKLALTERFVDEGAAVAAGFAPHVIHERLALFGTAGLRLAEVTGARHVVEVNALLSQEESQWRGLVLGEVAEARERAVLTGADRVVCVSEEWTRAVRRMRADGVETVPNGVDDRVFTAPVSWAGTRARLGLGPRTSLAVFVGTLRPWHGIDAALDLLSRLPDLHLAVVGDGPGAADLEREAVARGVRGRLVLTGHLPHARAAAVLRAADVGLAPYPSVPGFAFSPLKVLDYLAAGLPFVASDLGQIPALVEEFGSGRLVPPGDPAALADAVAATLADPRARERAGEARARVLREASWPARMRQVLAGLVPEPTRAVGA